MGAGAFIEPAVVISLLVGGTLVNRAKRPQGFLPGPANHKRNDGLESGASSPATENGLPSPYSRRSSSGYLAGSQHEGSRIRIVGLLGWQTRIRSPDTRQFANRFLSRVLREFPFLIEVWYWALIYWVYQLGRAFTAVTIVQGTVHTARRHALHVIHLEQRLHIFWELAIQRRFLQYPILMHWINRIYSFIHIPGTILFLIGLYYFSVTANRPTRRYATEPGPSGPALYHARRRTMAMCNLIAFVVFTAWPCMPPRLLSDPKYRGADAEEAKQFGFVDTVHGVAGESSVWTQNRFCNQYAAMPSLHFGYSLLIGYTVATIPIASQQQARGVALLKSHIRLPGMRRLPCMVLGFAYPAVILVAIVTTANHFILDALAGAFVCGIAWNTEHVLLNLLPLEDWFLWALLIHKPDADTESLMVWDEKPISPLTSGFLQG